MAEINTGNIVNFKPKTAAEIPQITPANSNDKLDTSELEGLSRESLSVFERMDRTFDTIANTLRSHTALLNETLKFHRDAMEKLENDKLREFDKPEAAPNDDTSTSGPSNKGLKKKMDEWFKQLLDGSKTGVSSFFGGATGSMLGMAKFAKPMFLALGGIALALMPSIGKYIMDVVKGVLHSTLGIKPEWVDAVTGFISDLHHFIFVKPLKEAFKAVKFLFNFDYTGTWATVRNYVTDMVDTMISTVEGWISAAVDTALAGWDWSTNMLSSITDMLINFGGAVVDGFKTLVTDPGKVWSWIKDNVTFEKIFGLGGDLYKSVTGLAIGLGKSLIDWFNGRTEDALALRETMFGNVEHLDKLDDMGISLNTQDRKRLKEAQDYAKDMLEDRNGKTSEEIAAAEAMLERLNKVEAKMKASDEAADAARDSIDNSASHDQLAKFLKSIATSAVGSTGELDEDQIRAIVSGAISALEMNGVVPSKRAVLDAITKNAGVDLNSLLSRPENSKKLEDAIASQNLSETSTNFGKKKLDKRFLDPVNPVPSMTPPDETSLKNYLDRLEGKTGSVTPKVVVPSGGGSSVMTNVNNVGGSNMTVYNTTVLGSTDLKPGYSAHFGQ